MLIEETPEEAKVRIRWRRIYLVLLLLWCCGFLYYLYNMMVLGGKPWLEGLELPAVYLFLMLSIIYCAGGLLLTVLYFSTAKPDYSGLKNPESPLTFRRDEYFHYRDK